MVRRMKPPCFGTYEVAQTSPCATCHLRGPCARKVELPAGLVLSASARIYARDESDYLALPGVAPDPAEVAHRIAERNFTVTRNAVRNSAKRLIARLAYLGPVVVVYSHLPRDVVAADPATNGCGVYPWADPRLSKKDTRSKSLRTRGTKVLCFSATQAARVVTAIAVMDAVD